MSNLHDKYFRLENALGYEFKNYDLLKTALTHRSVVNHNERLEYLGDSILGMLIAEKLYHTYPKSPEGDLTRMRSTLVKEPTLAEIARGFNLSDYMIMGPGEMRNGGYRRESILADAVEAIIAAIYLDSGNDIDKVRSVLMVWYEENFKNIKPVIEQKDPKSKLQELMQAKKYELPIYSVTNVEGEGHNQQFTVKLEISCLAESFIGFGTTIRKAEQQAAQKALDVLKNINLKYKK